MKPTSLLVLLGLATLGHAALARPPVRQVKTTSLTLQSVAVATPSQLLAPVPQTVPLHLERGLDLVDEINATHAQGIFADNQGVAVNRYGGSWNSQNDPSFIRFLDVNQGILPANNTECAPLITHLMAHAYNWDWDNYPFLDPKLNFQVNDTASPNPWQYLELIEQGVGFASQVNNVRLARPGDIIAIHYAGTTSGHAAILVRLHLENPVPYPANGSNLVPQLAGTTFYRMTVLDSTSSPHSNDTREFSVIDENDQETFHEIPGAGTGDMGLFLDNLGGIVGHTWSLPNSAPGTQGWLNRIKTDVKLQSQRTMVVGRLPAQP